MFPHERRTGSAQRAMGSGVDSGHCRVDLSRTWRSGPAAREVAGVLLLSRRCCQRAWEPLLSFLRPGIWLQWVSGAGEVSGWPRLLCLSGQHPVQRARSGCPLDHSCPVVGWEGSSFTTGGGSGQPGPTSSFSGGLATGAFGNLMAAHLYPWKGLEKCESRGNPRWSQRLP